MRITPAEFAATQTKIAKINERAAKKGFNGRVVLEGTEVVVAKVVNGFKVAEVMIDATITGEAPCYNGWNFLATLDWDAEAGLITRCAPGVDYIDRKGLVQGYCDHCKTNRDRRLTYLVTDGAQTVQVGSSCIKDFLGHEGRFAFLSEDEVAQEAFGGAGAFEPTYTVDTVLALAWAAIKIDGFVPTSSYSATPTATSVRSFLRPPAKRTPAFERWLEQMKAGAAEATERAQAVKEFILSDDFDGTSEYVYNLKAVAGAEHCSDRNIGLLASAPQAHAKHIERTLVRQEQDATPNEIFGEVKDKVTVSGKITSIRYIDNAYGTTVLYTIATEKGWVKWFASRDALGEEEGVQVTVQGTIKGHDEYQGRKSTVLTRCKAL